ncbi:MAG: hypothetical protein N2314_05290 [Brevinematales bacterium]|nr:hypothetical protein [Brevinematales bacterium]
MSRGRFLFFVVVFLVGCASSPTKSEVSFPQVDGQVLEYTIVQKGEIQVATLYLVGQGGTYDYALQYESPAEGVAMLFTVSSDQVKMVRRLVLPQGKALLKFNANADWVENAEHLKLELALKGSTKKTVITFEGR